MIVSDSSPLIYLAALGDLELLKLIFGTVAVPPAVHREVIIEGKPLLGVSEIAHALESWIVVTPAPREEKVTELLETHLIHRGESEALIVAAELPATDLLIDDRRAIAVASSLNLKAIRTTAVYVAAKRLGLVPSVRNKLDGLKRVGFWLSDRHYCLVLELAGEAESF